MSTGVLRLALMAEGTRFFDAVRTTPPYQLAVSPTPGLHQQVCVEQGSFVGRRRVIGFGSKSQICSTATVLEPLKAYRSETRNIPTIDG